MHPDPSSGEPSTWCEIARSRGRQRGAAAEHQCSPFPTAGVPQFLTSPRSRAHGDPAGGERGKEAGREGGRNCTARAAGGGAPDAEFSRGLREEGVGGRGAPARVWGGGRPWTPASPFATAADARALNDDDRGDRGDDKAGGVQSCGARSVSSEASGGRGGAG